MNELRRIRGRRVKETKRSRKMRKTKTKIRVQKEKRGREELKR